MGTKRRTDSTSRRFAPTWRSSLREQGPSDDDRLRARPREGGHVVGRPNAPGGDHAPPAGRCAFDELDVGPRQGAVPVDAGDEEPRVTASRERVLEGEAAALEPARGAHLAVEDVDREDQLL